MDYQFSASTLNIFNNCPRCFWFDVNKDIKRPRGIFPSLPGGIDKVLKPYFDLHRKNHTLPEGLADLPEGAKLFPDIELINKWRDWRTGLTYTSKQGVKIIGALDDCLQIGGFVAPLDYKTRGSAPRDNGDSQKYYGLQLSLYSFLLKEYGLKVTGKGYLIYYYPTKAGDLTRIEFSTKMVVIDAQPKHFIDIMVAAIKVLKSDKPPDMTVGCEHCIYREGL
jgi:hypothetical protein